MNKAYLTTEYDKCGPCVAVRYFYDKAAEEPTLRHLGPELHLTSGVVDLLPRIPSSEDAEEWFDENPNEELGFYILNKEELYGMIMSLLYILKNMED